MKSFNRILFPLLLLLGVLASTSAKYHNTPCTTATDCGLNTHLQCINNFCQCDTYNQIYDQNTNQCVLLASRECQVASKTDAPPIKCVLHADCSKSLCTCKQGYRLTTDFLCRPDYGVPCHAKDRCDETQGLSCSQGICQCFNSTWMYQGNFGCVDPNSLQFNEMIKLLNQTQTLLKENDLEIKDMFNDLGLQNDPNSVFIFGNMLAEARQFQDTYNTNDLQFAAQNQNPQQSGGGSGFNLGQAISLFQTFQSLLGRNQNNQGGGGGGGFFRNLFGGGNNQASGYPESSTAGYQASGQPEMMQGQRFNLINSFLNLFNQMIPIVRQLRMRFSPVKFIQNLLNRIAPTTTTAAPPPAAAIHSGPPTVIQHNGNFQANPIFDANQQPQSHDQAGNQGQGSFRFLMRTRERFRNAIRGNQGGYAPAKPPGKYGPPAGNYGPPAETEAPQPVAVEQTEGTAGATQQGFYVNQGSGFNNGQQAQQHANHATQPNYNTLPSSPVQTQSPAPAQRQQNFASLPSPSTFNSGHHPNPQSFFQPPQQQTQQQNHNANHPPQNQQFQNSHNHNNQNFNNNNHHQPQQHQQHHQQQTFNGQATSHHQSTFVPHPQPSQNHQQHDHHHPAQNNVQHSNYNYNNNNNNNRPPSVTSNNAPSPPPIPQFKLPVPQQQENLPQEAVSHNFILSEADDPHPGFTPITSTASPAHQGSYRTSARFERIGHDDSNHNPNVPIYNAVETTVANTAAQNWRESF